MTGEFGRTYYTYILASRINGTLYVGVTNDLLRRTIEHREHMVDGFTKRYNVTRLVHYEVFGEIAAAIAREKQLKNWKRAWKVQLIESNNPRWNDLYETLF
jgi:putative endonuclease